MSTLPSSFPSFPSVYASERTCADYLGLLFFGGDSRYTWLLWEQPANFNQETYYPPVTSSANFNESAIFNFNIPAFAGATGLSQPVGGSFALIGPQA